MVSGGGDRGWSCGGFPTLRQARGGRSRKGREKWGAPAHGVIAADNASQICLAGGGGSGALVRLQCNRLPQSAGVREWTLFGESHRAEDRDGESGERKSVGRRLVFYKSGGTERGRGELAGTLVAGACVVGKSGGRVQRARKSCSVVVGAPAFLCIIRG